MSFGIFCVVSFCENWFMQWSWRMIRPLFMQNTDTVETGTAPENDNTVNHDESNVNTYSMPISLLAGLGITACLGGCALCSDISAAPKADTKPCKDTNVFSVKGK